MSARATETYSEWLSRIMEERSFTVRSLARAWNPSDPEAARRSLKRYLNRGIVPILRTRIELSRVLGIEEHGPAGDDDQEGD